MTLEKPAKTRKKGHRAPAKKRNQVKYPNLDPKFNLITRREEIEDIASYTHLLNDEEKAWLNQFVAEEVNADLRKPVFNVTKEDSKRIYDKNNARNRCVFTRERAQNSLNLEGDMKDFDLLTNGHLDEEEDEFVGEEYE